MKSTMMMLATVISAALAAAPFIDFSQEKPRKLSRGA